MCKLTPPYSAQLSVKNLDSVQNELLMKYQINSKKVELQNTIKDLKDQIQKLKIGTDTNSNNESKKSSSNGIKDPNILKL